MDKSSSRPVLLFCCILVSLFLSCSAQSCSNYNFQSNQVFNSCTSLPHLDAHLHWTYNSSARRVNIAYRATRSTPGWVAWAINPTGTRMVGSQALVAYQNSTTGTVQAHTSSITGYSTTLQQGSLSFQVPNITAEYVNGQFIIFATLELTNTTVNQVWQEGPISNGVPATHSTTGPNVQSFGTLNFLSGERTTSGVLNEPCLTCSPAYPTSGMKTPSAGRVVRQLSSVLAVLAVCYVLF